MRIAAALVAGTIASAAHAQYFEIVINGPTTINPNQIIDYSLWLRDGHLLPDFVGWSSFAGRISGPGTHLLPNETAADNTTDDVWEGRRPPSNAGFPGGTGGGFRFAAQGYTAITDGLEGFGGLAFEGLSASAPLGGFLWNDSPDLEVFRGSLVWDVWGHNILEFIAVDAAYFDEATHSNTVIGVQSQMGSVGAAYYIVPAPASALLFGAGMLAVRRRR